MKSPIRLISAGFVLGVSACVTSEPADKVDFDAPPQWASEVVWYQIFPERFANGDPSNDPTPQDMVGTYPGIIPDDWQITPWGQDWYQPDPYCASLEGERDDQGNPITSFDQCLGLRRYGGDLQGVIDRLDYLEELGVSAIYFNPLNDSPSLHKYDARNYIHVDRNFGPSPRDDAAIMESEDPLDRTSWQWTGADLLFLDLLEETKARGIRVIMDFSWNHTGNQFWAWKDVVKNQEQSEYADWYWIDSFDDPATEKNEFRYSGWFGVPTLPELRETTKVDHAAHGIRAFEGDIASARVKQHIFDVTRRWLDPNGDGDPSDGVDGFRLDVAAEVPLGFWREYRKFVRSINPEALLLGEVWYESFPDGYLDPAPFLEGDVFGSVMNYRWTRDARSFFTGEPNAMSPSQFAAALSDLDIGLRDENRYALMNMSASHDTPRLATALFNPGTYKLNANPLQDPAFRYQKPDADTFNTMRLMLAQQFTYVGAPQIWAGDEMGMWGGEDPHTRKPLIWPDLNFDVEKAAALGGQRPGDEVSFDTELNDYYRTLIQLRSNSKALQLGTFEIVAADDDAGIFAYRRSFDGDSVFVVFNVSRQPQIYSLPPGSESNLRDILQPTRDLTSGAIDLAPRTVAILVAGN